MQVWQAILSQRIDMGAPELKNVSPPAKDLLAGLLERDPDSRLTPKQALDHPWIRVRPPLSCTSGAGLGVLPAH